ncbi:MAG: glycosyltransferase [Mobilicoccus sp.]|nr:glycosyltransferase [Mobilicoccus sp.]
MNSLAAAVVIPAHNEEQVIGACLEALDAARDDGLEVEVIVVANGCTDGTADVARQYPDVRVIEQDEPSKRLALDTGDAAATRFPRIFLDADIRLGSGALRQLVAALSVPEPRVGSPTVRFDMTGASVSVRSFYRAFEQLPYVRHHLIGLGVYGLSEQGRARFDRFPEVVADDLFIQRLFADEERVVVPGEFWVRVPRDLRNLLKVRTRVARGNSELAGIATDDDEGRFAGSTGATGRALRDLARSEPARIPDVAVYVAVTLAARLRARRAAARGRSAWERDDSSRAAG